MFYNIDQLLTLMTAQLLNDHLLETFNKHFIKAFAKNFQNCNTLQEVSIDIKEMILLI